jgi:predicted Zn-dependent protease
MLAKLLPLALLVVLFLVLFFPRRIPGLLRRAGRSVGDLGRMGGELATGEEVEGSPLARHEARAGEIVALRVLSEHPPAKDEGLARLVGEIGGRLAAHARRREIAYRFAALESDEPNAFAVPGGSIFITRPLIDLCGRDPQLLAGVLAHEVIHVDRRHAVQSLAATFAVRTGIRILSFGRGAILSRLAGGMQDLMAQGYRQDQELEADLLGSRLAASAGFDPRGLAAAIERLAALRPEGRGPVAEALQYLKSHPPASLRLERLRRACG